MVVSLFNTFYSWYLRSRFDQIHQVLENPEETQQRTLSQLLQKMRYTAWGKHYELNSIQHIGQLKERIPVQNYEQIKPWIDRMMKGEQQVLWPGEIRWFAKSSGTTSDKSKFIPVSFESLEECHLRAARDILTVYCQSNPETRIFSGKGLVMGGSHQVNNMSPNIFYGDLSAVLMQNLPFWVHFIRTPDLSIALLSDWEEKIEKMARQTMQEDVTSISGVPTWTLVLIERLFELSGKKDLKDIWPNLELYIHGGVSFTPYRERFQQLFPHSGGIHFLETYNASEGFFGVQMDPHSPHLSLMMDYGIYYEFMPMSEYGKEFPGTLTLSEVKTGENYALVITTNSGLCRYLVGDTIRFQTLKPYTFTISGRTKHFINAFGEEVIIENAEAALAQACLQTGAVIRDYTAAPIYFSEQRQPGHEWAIEFDKAPEQLSTFIQVLDLTLQKVNSDYEAKRFKDMAMQLPTVHAVKSGTFHEWLKRKGKLGGQHKVPRLCNDRHLMDELLPIAGVRLD